MVTSAHPDSLAPRKAPRVVVEGRVPTEALALVARLYGAEPLPMDGARVDVLVVGMHPTSVDGITLQLSQPRRVICVAPWRQDVRHAEIARAWQVALPDAHVLLLEMGRVRELGTDEAARVARVTLAAMWGVRAGAGPFPLLPGAPASWAE